jgi:hypothetical protein
MPVCTYGGGRALVYVIVGGGHQLWFLLLLVLWWGTGWRIGRSECIKLVALHILMLDAFLSVLVLLWCRTLRVAHMHVRVLHRDHCTFGVLSVALVNVVMGSARSTDTVLCCMWKSLLNWHCLLLYTHITIKLYAVIALLSLYGLCQVLSVQTACCCVDVMWWPLCVDLCSGLCWGKG